MANISDPLYITEHHWEQMGDQKYSGQIFFFYEIWIYYIYVLWYYMYVSQSKLNCRIHI